MEHPRLESSEQKRKFSGRFRVTRHIWDENFESMDDPEEKERKDRRPGRGNNKRANKNIERRRYDFDSDSVSDDGKENGPSMAQSGRRVSWADELVTVHEYIKDKKTHRWPFMCIPIRLSV